MLDLTPMTATGVRVATILDLTLMTSVTDTILCSVRFNFKQNKRASSVQVLSLAFFGRV